VDFDKAVAELDALVKTLEREGDERALMLLELVDAIHRPALKLIAEGKSDHPLARALLGMYGLVDVDEEILVEEALDEVRPYIHSHGGEVELLEVEDGVVRIRMSGSCHGCAASTQTLKRGIEESLRTNYPGFRQVVAEEVNGPVEASGPLLQIEGVEHARRPVFVEAGGTGDVGPGEIRATEVDGVPVLLVNVDGEVYAFRNACPVDGMSLEGARLSDTVLVCPWHNCAFDARSGKRLDDEGGADLPVVPIAIHKDRLQVAVNVL
jgi:Fe-S cluster biogenesis protein NfuA/nitrite reductase/ring-hydroxylating ferredoxin subunit